MLCEKPLANTRRRGRGDEPRPPSRPRPTASGPWSASPTAGCPRSPWPGSWSPRAGSATIRHVRAQYLQDWIVDPEAPLSWRLDKDKAGSGALGDIGAHIVDLTQHITGDVIGRVSGRLRDLRRASARSPSRARRHSPGRPVPGRGPVTVDDAAVFLAEFRGGALGVFEATRFATGRKNAIRIEVNGSAGSLAFDFEDMNVLQLLRRAPSRPRPPASAGSWSPSPSTRTSAPGGRPATGSATSTASPTRSSTWSRRSPRATSRRPSFADGLAGPAVLARSRRSSDAATPGRTIPA